ncbi:MAG: CCA tRNA nucleotidyltransferase [Planctomycetota bacterium]
MTRIEPPELPAHVAACLAALNRGGGRGWLVGGAVRDLLQGRAPRDFDVATDLTPAEVAGRFEQVDARSGRLGTSVVHLADHAVTVTTLRAEGAYSDGRRPDEVTFVRDVARDAKRRDFTVNALYLDAARGELLDPCDGRADLSRRSLRCVGEPAARFREDPLRLLRLARFCGSAGLDVETTTAAAARTEAAGLRSLSAERVFSELTDMFTGEGRGRALRALVDLGLAAVVLPEVAAMDRVPQPPEYHPEGDVLTHVALVLDHVPEGDAALGWSAVLHDVGKPPTFRVAEDRIRFDGHDELSAKMAEQVLRRLRAPGPLREAVVDVCRHHIRFAALPQMRPVRAERWMRTPGFPLHLAFHYADCMGSHQKLGIYEFARERLAALPPQRAPLLQGRDVLALGVPKGPLVGELLREVEARIEARDEPASRADALVLLRDAVEARGQGGGDRGR